VIKVLVIVGSDYQHLTLLHFFSYYCLPFS